MASSAANTTSYSRLAANTRAYVSKVCSRRDRNPPSRKKTRSWSRLCSRRTSDCRSKVDRALRRAMLINAASPPRSASSKGLLDPPGVSHAQVHNSGSSSSRARLATRSASLFSRNTANIVDPEPDASMKSAKTYDSFDSALVEARAHGERILITGSLHFAGEALARLQGEPAAFEECAQ